MRPLRRNHAAGEVLLASVRSYGGSLPDRIQALAGFAGVERVRDAAMYHRVTSFVYKAFRQAGHDEMVATVRPSYYQTVLTHQRTCEDLADLAAAMKPLSVPWLVVKGPVLAEGVYPEPDLRPYGDLDAVVRPQDFPAVVEGLERAGFRLIDQNWVLARAERFGEIHFLLPRGTVLDLHWHLLNQHALRESFPIRTNDLFEQTRQVTVADTTVATLSAEETVVHLALHAAMAGANRLIWLLDLRLASAATGLDWEKVTTLARARRINTPVYTALRRARHVLEASVPATVLDGLNCPRTWRAVTAATDALAPAQQSTSHGSIGRMVSRSSRETLRSSLSNLSQRIGSRTAAFVSRRDPHTLDDEQASVMHPTGGPSERQAFIASVATER